MEQISCDVVDASLPSVKRDYVVVFVVVVFVVVVVGGDGVGDDDRSFANTTQAGTLRDVGMLQYG